MCTRQMVLIPIEKYGLLKKKHDDTIKDAVGVRNMEVSEEEIGKNQTDTNVKDAITREHDFDGELEEPATQSAPLKRKGGTIRYDPVQRRFPWIRL